MVSSDNGWNGYNGNGNGSGNSNDKNSVRSGEPTIVFRASANSDPVLMAEAKDKDSSSRMRPTSSSSSGAAQQQQQQQQQDDPEDDPEEAAASKKEQQRHYNEEGHLEDSDGDYPNDNEQASNFNSTSNGNGHGSSNNNSPNTDNVNNSDALVDIDEDDIHHDLSPRECLVEYFQHVRYYCGQVINDDRVQILIVALIAINAIMLGIGTFEFVTDNPQVDNAFEIIDQTMLIIFTVELAMQTFYHGWRLVTDGWLVFDLIIIVTSWSFSQVQIIRAFRIFRALRLITRIKVMKNLVLALFSVMPRMFAIGLLLFLVSYIFAVMFTQLFKDLYERGLTDEDYFGRMDDTFFTLTQIMTLDNWADIARQVMAVYSWAWLPFVVFVIVTSFVVVNLIIAVICDAISALHDDEKAKLHGTFEEEETTNNESTHPALQQDVREQLGALEDHVEELTRMQEQTLHSLAMLTRQIQLQRHARTQSQPLSQPLSPATNASE